MKAKIFMVLFAAGVAVMGCSSTQNTGGSTDSVTTVPTNPTDGTTTDTTTTDTTTTDTSTTDTGMRR